MPRNSDDDSDDKSVGSDASSNRSISSDESPIIGLGGNNQRANDIFAPQVASPTSPNAVGDIREEADPLQLEGIRRGRTFDDGSSVEGANDQPLPPNLELPDLYFGASSSGLTEQGPTEQKQTGQRPADQRQADQTRASSLPPRFQNVREGQPQTPKETPPMEDSKPKGKER